MTYEQILTEIHKKNFASVYFLTGEEPYFIDIISDTIENEALDEADRAFNQIVLYGRDVDVETIANHARSFPMMGERMVVIVKEAQDVKNLEEFEKYLDTIPETTLLVQLLPTNTARIHVQVGSRLHTTQQILKVHILVCINGM